MKRNTNKQLYESIMKDVSKIIKRKLNEEIEYSEIDDDLFDALKYVMEYIDKQEIDYLVYKMDKERCPANMINQDLVNNITDYMNEFAEDNDLPEDFWINDYDDDDLIYKLYDLFND